MKRLSVLIAILALSVAGCARLGQPSTAAAPRAPATRVPVSRTGATPALPPATVPAVPSPRHLEAAPCDPATMLEAVNRYPFSPDFAVLTAHECRNGYALVFAELPPSPPAQFDSEQIFLKDAGGTWEVLTEGTGITCDAESLAEEAERIPELPAACRALGLT